MPVQANRLSDGFQMTGPDRWTGRVRLSAHFADVVVQPGFLTGGLVLVHDAFAHRAIDGWNGFLIGFTSGTLVAGFNRCEHLTDAAADQRSLAGIVLTALLLLPCTLTG